MTISNTATHLSIAGPEQIQSIVFDDETIDFSLFGGDLSALSSYTLALIGVTAENAIYDINLNLQFLVYDRTNFNMPC